MSSSLLYVLAILLTRVCTEDDEAKIRFNSRFYNMDKNWTSCEEFLEDVQFNAKDLVNIDWKIFYFWNPELEDSYNIRFSWPSPMLIDRYKGELDKELKEPVNWTDAELFMDTSIDFSALCIKTGTPGLYRIIPSLTFKYFSAPVMHFAFKVVEPGYLGIVNCKFRIAYALAPVDKMPFHYEINKAASSLQFYNQFNRSHLEVTWSLPLNSSHVVDLPDDEQEEDLELDGDPGIVDFF